MKAVIAVISDLVTDMRVKKQAQLLKDEGYSVTVIGRNRGDSTPVIMPGIKILRIHVPLKRGPGMYLLFNLFLFFQLVFRHYDLCVACDLDTLVPCFLTSRMKRRKLVYDAHEYFTQQHGLAERKFKYNIWKRVEKYFVPRVNHMITVSRSIAGLYQKEYGIKPVVIRNVAPDTGNLIPHNRRELRASDDELLVIFQGSGINEGRGAEELIKAITMTKKVRLVIIGSGDIIDRVRQLVADNPVSDMITVFPRMQWEEMMRYTMCCDAGLSLDTDTCINQRYSLPNKLFDYIAAGIPAIVSPLPEVSEIINKYGCGVILNKITSEEIAATLENLRNNKETLISLKRKSIEAGKELNWENEKKAEQMFFRNVMEL